MRAWYSAGQRAQFRRRERCLQPSWAVQLSSKFTAISCPSHVVNPCAGRVNVRWTDIKEKWRRRLNRNAAATSTDRPRPRYRALKWTGGIIVGTLAAIVLVLALLDWNMLRGPI